MRLYSYIALLAMPGLVGGCSPGKKSFAADAAPASKGAAHAFPADVPGQTQPVAGRSATIAPVVLHDVTAVLIVPGDRVKKDQPLIKLDDDEAQADLRTKQAALAELKASLARLKAQPREQERAEARALLEVAAINLKHAREVLDRMGPAYATGAIPDHMFHEARVALIRLAAEERAAVARLERLLKQPVELEIAELTAKVAASQAAVDAAQAELEHYTVTAPIDGVVSRLEVNAGTVSRPGTTVWGEILDLSEIDTCCNLTPQQVDRVRLGQPAEVILDGSPAGQWTGKVVSIGIAADPGTGHIPVRVRLQNPKGRLRCYIHVGVRFDTRPVALGGK
jgi:multidrug resistance efflux pump